MLDLCARDFGSNTQSQAVWGYSPGRPNAAVAYCWGTSVCPEVRRPLGSAIERGDASHGFGASTNFPARSASIAACIFASSASNCFAGHHLRQRNGLGPNLARQVHVLLFLSGLHSRPTLHRIQHLDQRCVDFVLLNNSSVLGAVDCRQLSVTRPVLIAAP